MDQEIVTQQPIVEVKANRLGAVRWSLIVGIMVVFNLFVAYATRSVYHEPQREEFCPQSQVQEPIVNRDACLSIGGQWVESSTYPPSLGQTVPNKIESYCNREFTCQKDYEAALKVYNRNFFVVFVVAGVIALVGSLLITGSTVVSFGLAFGGTLSFIIGSIVYWSDMNDWLRVGILGFALAVLVWLGYKRFRDE